MFARGYRYSRDYRGRSASLLASRLFFRQPLLNTTLIEFGFPCGLIWKLDLDMKQVEERPQFLDLCLILLVKTCLIDIKMKFCTEFVFTSLLQCSDQRGARAASSHENQRRINRYMAWTWRNSCPPLLRHDTEADSMRYDWQILSQRALRLRHRQFRSQKHSFKQRVIAAVKES